MWQIPRNFLTTTTKRLDYGAGPFHGGQSCAQMSCEKFSKVTEDKTANKIVWKILKTYWGQNC